MKRFSLITIIALALALAAPVSVSYAARKKKAEPKQETSADVRLRQEAAQREIRATREQIRLNDRAVQKNLNELGRLQDDINAGRKRVADAGQRVESLQKQIGELQSQIAADGKRLETLRAEYLKSVKKMRAKRKENSMLAFIFSSDSFNEALRRMRYLRQFSDWRQKQSDEIGSRVASLKTRSDQLAQTKTQHDRALSESVAAQKELQTQYARQDAIVTDLKRNGEALQSHLAKKQSEANELKGRISALIAEEQRKAEADRQARARAEAELKAQAEARARAEAKAREKELAEAQAREKALAEAKAAEKKQSQSRKAAAAPKATPKAAPKAAPKATPKSNKREDVNKDKGQEKSYAEARGRKPRARREKPSASSAPAPDVARPKAPEPRPVAPPAPASSGFEGMKGRLPRPVAGSFRVTNPFGTHSLPNMPNVSYDNPGIDAEVPKGASAQAVYAGTVSGVYMVPGYATVVIVNHGGYYTVYGNISAAAVKVGDKVKQGQNLGRLAADEDNPGHSLIHFEVWKNREKQNPMAWIK